MERAKQNKKNNLLKWFLAEIDNLLLIKVPILVVIYLFGNFLYKKSICILLNCVRYLITMGPFCFFL